MRQKHGGLVNRPGRLEFREAWYALKPSDGRDEFAERTLDRFWNVARSDYFLLDRIEGTDRCPDENYTTVAKTASHRCRV